MSEFLSTLYFGNTLVQWLIALLLILGAVVVGRILYWVFGKWVKRLAARTNTRLDDVLIDLFEEPFVAVFVLFGVRYALSTLTITSDVVKQLDTLFTIALILIITWFVLRLYDALHREYLVPLSAKTNTDLDDQLLPVLRTGIKFVLISLGVVVALSNAGYDVGAILAGLGIAGLAFALAAQDTVSNILGGIAMFIHRPFKMNDRIQVGGIEGYVRELGLRSSTIQKISGERVLMPNKVYITEAVTNLSTANYYFQSDRFHLHRDLTGEKLESVLKWMDEAGKPNANILWAQAFVAQAGEYSIDVDYAYGVKPWVAGEGFDHHLHKMAVVRSELIRAILRAFEQNDVKLAVPILSMQALNGSDRTLFQA